MDLSGIPGKPIGEPVYESDPIYDVRNRLIAWFQDHQRGCDEETCAEPVNALAWLAHAVGLKDSHIEDFRRRLDEYNRTCPNCTRWN